MPRRISVKTGRQQVPLSTVGRASGQGTGHVGKPGKVGAPDARNAGKTAAFAAPRYKFIVNTGVRLLPPLTIGNPLRSPARGDPCHVGCCRRRWSGCRDSRSRNPRLGASALGGKQQPHLPAVPESFEVAAIESSPKPPVSLPELRRRRPPATAKPGRLVTRPITAPRMRRIKQMNMLETGAAIWQGRQDSNLRPSVLETDALPTELHPCMAPL